MSHFLALDTASSYQTSYGTAVLRRCTVLLERGGVDYFPASRRTDHRRAVKCQNSVWLAWLFRGGTRPHGRPFIGSTGAIASKSTGKGQYLCVPCTFVYCSTLLVHSSMRIFVNGPMAGCWKTKVPPELPRCPAGGEFMHDDPSIFHPMSCRP